MSITKDEMVAALKEASKLGYLGGMGGGGGGTSGGGGGGGDLGSGRFGKELGAAGDAAKGLGTAAAMVGSKLAEGGARVSDATDALAAGFGGLGATGSAFGTVLEKGSKALASLGQDLDKNINKCIIFSSLSHIIITIIITIIIHIIVHIIIHIIIPK